MQPLFSSNFVLFLLNYTRNEQSNVFETIVEYTVFAHNILKHAIKTVYYMELAVSYKSIYHFLGTNANGMGKKLRK